MDLIHDRAVDGRSVPILSVLDGHARECGALQLRLSFRGEEVTGVLSRSGATGRFLR